MYKQKKRIGQMGQFIPFVKKELLHIIRDRRTMAMIIAMPVILIILFGYAITNEIREAPIAVVDYSHDGASREIIRHISASEYFDIKYLYNDESKIQSDFLSGRIKMAVVFPAGLEADIARGQNPQINILSDASDPNEASSLSAYIKSTVAFALAQAYPQPQSDAAPVAVKTELSLLYNPQMKGAYNFVPGVMGLILLLLCAMMTSIGIVREKEKGSMEVLLVSPLKPVYIVVAKAVPYLALSMVNVVTILLLSRYLLGVPIRGSVWLVFFLATLFALVSLALGLLISSVADNQGSAMMMSGIGLMLPVMLLSGMVFPVENMPAVLQWLSNIVPAKWFITAVRDVMIKGLGFRAISLEISVLGAMAAVLLIVSVMKFKNRLE